MRVYDEKTCRHSSLWSKLDNVPSFPVMAHTTRSVSVLSSIKYPFLPFARLPPGLLFKLKLYQVNVQASFDASFQCNVLQAALSESV